MIDIEALQLPHGQDLPLPSYQSDEAAGMDLYAAIPANEDVILSPGQRKLIDTGLSIALPKGYEAQIRPRSGLAFKHGITVLNSPGTVDSDYRGELKVLLINHGDADFTITRAERIAQMVIAPVSQAKLLSVNNLDTTNRGAGGYGSTGV